MDKRMLKITITQLRQIALFAVGMSLLTACGNSQSGMKLGDAEFAVVAVNSTTSDKQHPIRLPSKVRRISKSVLKFLDLS